LSSSEILSLYTKPFTCSCASSSSSNQTDCDTTNLNVGKVLHLDFNGNTQDKSGNNNHATNFGATLVAGKDGLANSAYRFNGSSNYMQVANNSSINSFSNNKITLCAIVKPKGFYNGICYGNAIIDKGSQDFLTGNYLLRYSPIHPSASCTIADVSKSNFYGGYYNGGCTYSEIDNSPKVKIDTWYCVVNTYDGDTIKTYVDGILRHKCLFIGGIGSNIQDVFIGRKNNTTFPYWHNGDIDDIRIYNRALSASEVKGYCGTCNVSPPISVKCDTGKKYIYTKCFNDTIQLNVGKGKNHQWSPTTDLSNGTIQNPKCFAKSSIQYFVLYNDTNNCQIIDTIQINVFPSNHIPLFDSNVCIGDSIFYSLDNNGTNYNWNPNQYLSSNNQSSAWIKPFANTSYNISYKDINGCKILDTFNIKTKACCDLKAQFEISDSIICKSGVVSIFNKSKNITTGVYTWEFKNLTPSQFTGYSPASISLNSTGTYSIKLKTSNGICEDSMTRNIYVIDIKANAGKDSIFCTGRISNFKIGDTNTISDYKYSWNPTLGLDNAYISSPTVNISQNQQYELSVFDPFTGCIALDTIILTINSNLDTFNYVDTLCEGDTKVFFGQNIMIDGTYQHYVKDNQNCDIEVHILKVFFRKISYTNSIQKACNFYIDKMGIKHTYSFEYNDTTYTKGCTTNIHTTKIKILKTRYEETEMTACYKINWKGNTYYDTIKKIDSFVFKDNGCDTLVKYLNLNVVKKAEIKINSTHSNPLNYGEEIILQAFGSNNYKWNTGERGFQISHKAKENNVFYVIGYNNVLCPDTAYYNIYIDNNSGIELPDIFSPNEDGKNDIFRPNYKGNVQILDFIVYNRWGEKIYEGHGNESFWDGKYKGEYQSSGVYIYLFNYIFNGKQVSKKGSFVLVR
jgi:gliding motility-associated-like protein